MSSIFRNFFRIFFGKFFASSRSDRSRAPLRGSLCILSHRYQIVKRFLQLFSDLFEVIHPCCVASPQRRQLAYFTTPGRRSQLFLRGFLLFFALFSGNFLRFSMATRCCVFARSMLQYPCSFRNKGGRRSDEGCSSHDILHPLRPVRRGGGRHRDDLRAFVGARLHCGGCRVCGAHAACKAREARVRGEARLYEERGGEPRHQRKARPGMRGRKVGDARA